MFNKPKNDKYKETHIMAHYNKIVKRQNQRTIKAIKEEVVIYGEFSIRVSADFSAETLEDRRP